MRSSANDDAWEKINLLSAERREEGGLFGVTASDLQEYGTAAGEFKAYFQS